MNKSFILAALIMVTVGINVFAEEEAVVVACVRKLDCKTDFELDQGLECIHSRMPRVAPLLIKELGVTTNERIQSKLIEILGEHKVKEAIPQIFKYLNVKNEKVRESAAEALFNMQDEGTLPAFYGMRKDKNKSVRYFATWALIKFHKKGKISSEVASEIKAEIETGYLRSLNPRNRQIGINFAIEMGAEEFTPIIEELAADDTYYFIVKKRDRYLNPAGEEGIYPVRQAARKALMRLKSGYDSVEENKKILSKPTTAQ